MSLGWTDGSTTGLQAVLTFIAPYVANAISGYTIEHPSAFHAGTIVTQIDRDVERDPAREGQPGGRVPKGMRSDGQPCTCLPSKHLGCVNDRTQSSTSDKR